MRNMLRLFFVVSLISTPGYAATLLVPSDDYETIQAAVNKAAPGDVIEVGPGSFAGAVIWKPLTIVGSIGTVIDEPGPLLDAFRILQDASGTEIRGMTIEGVQWGIFGDNADDVNVIDNVFKNTMRPISNYDGSGWEIKRNIIDGLDSFGHPNTHMDAIVVAAFSSPAKENEIINNWIRHVGPRPYAIELFYIGILLINIDAELAKNLVVNNYVELSVAGLIEGDYLAGINLVSFGNSSGIVGNKILHNELCVTSNPIDVFALDGGGAEMLASNLIKANVEVCEDYGD